MVSEFDRKVEAMRAKRQAAIDEAVASERERCAKIAEWFHNVENFTAADVARRIRDPNTK
jgi:hypothetical protein